jgi:hypothetical protein
MESLNSSHEILIKIALTHMACVNVSFDGASAFPVAGVLDLFPGGAISSGLGGPPSFHGVL